MAKTTDEKMKELEQRIHRLQTEKKRLQKQKESNERKKRDHAMILVGTTIMTHFPEEKERIINSSDEEIKSWVHSIFEKTNDPFS